MKDKFICPEFEKCDEITNTRDHCVMHKNSDTCKLECWAIENTKCVKVDDKILSKLVLLELKNGNRKSNMQ